LFDVPYHGTMLLASPGSFIAQAEPPTHSGGSEPVVAAGLPSLRKHNIDVFIYRDLVAMQGLQSIRRSAG
jgi:hypothetical protein